MLGGGGSSCFLFHLYSVSSEGTRRHTRCAEPPHVPAKPLNNTCPKPDSCFLNLKWLTEPPDVFNLQGRCEQAYVPLHTFSEVLHDNYTNHGPWQLWSISPAASLWHCKLMIKVVSFIMSISLYASWGKALSLNVSDSAGFITGHNPFWTAVNSVWFLAA